VILQARHSKGHVQVETLVSPDPVVLTGLLRTFDNTVTFDHTGRNPLVLEGLFEHGHVMDHTSTDAAEFQAQGQTGHNLSHL
jgi:hypothetical protein